MRLGLLITLYSLSVCYLAGQKETEKLADAINSPSAIVQELLDLITAEPGEARDFVAMRNLFSPDVRFTALYRGGDFGVPYESIGLDDFIEMMQDEYYTNGFTEVELHQEVDEFNVIAQVFQTYYGEDSEGEREWGISSYQLVFYEGRWWIYSILWTGADRLEDIPEAYRGSH